VGRAQPRSTLELSADVGLSVSVYTAEPGSKADEALSLFASWTATSEPAEPATEAT